MTGASIARKIRSGTLVGPGIWRKWRPVWIMSAPSEVEAKLYMLDEAERNLRPCVQVDETAGRGVRMMKAIRGEILPQPVAGAGVQLEMGVCHDHTGKSNLVGGNFDGRRIVVMGTRRASSSAISARRRNLRNCHSQQGLRFKRCVG